MKSFSFCVDGNANALYTIVDMIRKPEVLTLRTDKVVARVVRKLAKEDRRTVSEFLEYLVIAQLKAMKNGK